MNSLEKSFVVKISLIMATRMLGLFMIFPVFSIVTSSWDANFFLIGFAIGIYGLTQALLQIPFGYLSDKFGRKPLIIIGLLIFAIGSLISAIGSENQNIYLVILGRFIAGMGAIASVLMAFIADVIKAENRSKANAFVGMQIALSFMIAIIFAPIIVDYFNLSGIFYFATILAIVSLFVVVLLPNTQQKSQYSLSLDNIKQTFNTKIIAFDFSIFSLHFILTSIFISIPLRLLDLNTWLTYLIVFATSFAIIIPFIIKAEKQNKHKNIIIMAIALLFISQFLLYFNIDSIVIAMVLIIFFIGFNLIESLTPSIIARWSDANAPEKRGLIMSFYSTSQFLGAFFGGIIAGLLHNYINNSAIYVFNIILIIIWFLVIFRKRVWQE